MCVESRESRSAATLPGVGYGPQVRVVWGPNLLLNEI